MDYRENENEFVTKKIHKYEQSYLINIYESLGWNVGSVKKTFLFNKLIKRRLTNERY